MSGTQVKMSDGKLLHYIQAVKTEFVIAEDDGGPGVCLCITMTSQTGTVRKTILTPEDLVELAKLVCDTFRETRNGQASQDAYQLATQLKDVAETFIDKHFFLAWEATDEDYVTELKTVVLPNADAMIDRYKIKK